jgi:hypothetical protein
MQKPASRINHCRCFNAHADRQSKGNWQLIVCFAARGIRVYVQKSMGDRASFSATAPTNPRTTVSPVATDCRLQVPTPKMRHFGQECNRRLARVTWRARSLPAGYRRRHIARRIFGRNSSCDRKSRQIARDRSLANLARRLRASTVAVPGKCGSATKVMPLR